MDSLRAAATCVLVGGVDSKVYTACGGVGVGAGSASALPSR